MKFVKPAAVTVSAVALAVLPSVTAAAHNGEHPFPNCSAAYEAGYADIERGDEHYGAHLDRDEDGVGCDAPPADFVPAEDEDTSQEGTDGASGEDGTAPADGSGSEGTTDGKELAETGGDAMTPYVAGAGAAVLLAGVGLVVVRRRRATD